VGGISFGAGLLVLGLGTDDYIGFDLRDRTDPSAELIERVERERERERERGQAAPCAVGQDPPVPAPPCMRLIRKAAGSIRAIVADSDTTVLH
jgi:hypothetical protein